ncbi:VCBS domain-containing protein [Pararhizobium sp. A13]|uniref:beta strand repeat-containing protein n=1 Tax=Pararhizobium sp. A13 TaxID=3133975 RepID=UPI00311AFF50
MDRTVSVTITGTNDAPVVAATDVTGAVTEQVTPVGNLTDTGTLAFTDVDLTDAHSISPTITASAGALGALTASVTTDTTGSGLGGVITWNYSVADSDVEYLAKDQTKVETFTITLDDGNGGTVDRTVSVTITGTNDAPVVAATDVTGAVTEQVTPVGNLTDTGTLAFTDVDLTDAHSISPTITASAGALGALTASVTTDTTGSGLGGVITWNYSVADSDVEYLAKDQTKVETFTITLDDGNGGTVDRTVSVTITGTNDAPVVAATDVTGAVTEQVTPVGNLTDTGTLAFTDVDLTDAHSISPTITASAGALGALTASVTTDTTGSGLGGVITWNYSVADSDVEYLAKDQTKVETFTITLDDGNGGTVDRTVSVTITGTNDAPVVAATDVTGAVTEQVTPVGNLTDTGTLAFTDVDLTDAHSISPTITASAGALGALTASVTTDTTGSGLGGVITWNYSVADSDVEYLAKDQTKVETFTITLDDGNGGTVDRTVSVTITGTNDAPVVAATDVTGAVTEQVTPVGNLTDTGTLAFTDVDLTDAHSISPTITASAGALGALTASVTTDTTGSGLGGVITWNYSVADSDVEYLAKDQTKVETFTITLDDGNGGTVDRTVSVTITGTNDAPVVAATDVTGAVTEQVTPVGNLTDTGTLAFTDVDLTDAHSISPTITASAGALGALTASVTTDTTGSGLGGVITWNYSVADSDVEYLAKDQTKVETFTITLDDGNGGTVDRTVSVTITGTNDAPVVAATDVTGAVTEQVTPVGNLTDTGTLAFTDVDLTDAHSISPTITASAGALGALTASVTTDTTGSGLGGVITWNYSVADSDVEYLAKDQTKVETFTITLDDGNGGTVDRTVSVTITGTNDAPVVAATDVTGAVTEQVTPVGNLTDTGTLAFTDVDLTDAHSISPTITASAGALGALTASVTTDTTGSGLGGVITWNYSVADSDVEYLAKDQTKVETFTITLDDGNGGTVDRTVSVTITGTNDAPVVAATDVTGAVTEQVTPVGNLTDTGTLAFTDVDLTDAHSISPTITASAGALGALTASVTTDTTGSGLGGVITWNYSVADSDVEYLAKDQTKVETFTITLDDGNGGTVDRTVSVTITGTNDAPVVAATDVTGAVTEQVTPVGNLTDTGTLAFTDVDLTDAHSISPTITASAGALGALTASVTTDTTGSGLGGVITWNYSVADSDVEYLAKDQTKVETFTITLDDGNGGTVDRTVSVTITGTNDAPVLSDTTNPTAVAELTDASAQNLAAITGNFSVSDLDVGDTLTPSVVGSPTVLLNGSAFTLPAGAAALTAGGAFTLTGATSTGGAVNIGYNYDPAAANLDFLRAGQSLTITYVVQVNDGTTYSGTQDVTFTITGSNDAPVLSDTTNPAAVAELANASAQDLAAITGSFAVSDLDVGDTLTASVVGSPTVLLNGNSFTLPAGAAALTAAGAFSISPLTQTSNGGPGTAIGYTYDPAAANLDFLREGQSLTITYAVKVNDGTTDSATQDVTFTVTGTNDAPVLSDTTNPTAVVELTDASAQNLAPIIGNFAVSDKDMGDTLTASVVGSPTVLLNGSAFTLPAGTAALTAAGAFSISPLTQTSNGGTGTAIGYTYDPAAANLDFLREGQSLTITYVVQVNDGTTSSGTQDVTFTITGTNDAPVLSDTTNPAAVVELTDASAQNLSPITGNFSVNDLDVGDTLTPSVVGSPTVLLNGSAFTLPAGAAALTAGGAFTLTGAASVGGAVNVGYNYDPAAANLDFLAAGASLTITYAVKVNDGTTDSATQDVTITITGTNDGPTAVGANVITDLALGNVIAIPEWALLSNDKDPEGNPIVDVAGIGTATGGSVTHTAGTGTNGTVNFIDAAPAGGTFTYTATDGTTTGAPGTVNVSQDSGTTLDGTAGDDILISAGSGTTLVGGTGDDVLISANGNDLYRFGLADGQDIVSDTGSGSDDIEVVTSSASTDVGTLNFERVVNDLVVNVGTTEITIRDHFVGSGNVEDLTFSNGGTVYGYNLGTAAYSLLTVLSGSGSSQDAIASSSAGQTLTGNNGNDLLFGNGGIDTINGDNGNDLLVGGADDDILNGGGGNDWLMGGAGNDAIDGGSNIDLIDFADGTSGVTFTLIQSSSNTVFNASAAGLGTDTYKNMEGVVGTNFADTLNGSSSADILMGLEGIDTISGNAGDDTITGGAGQDILTGGANNDTFVLNGTTADFDVITDFVSANDTLSFTGFSLANNALGVINQVRTVTVTGGAGNTISSADLVVYNIAADSVDSGTEVDNLLATQNNTFNGGVFVLAYSDVLASNQVALYYDSDANTSGTAASLVAVFTNYTNVTTAGVPSATADYVLAPAGVAGAPINLGLTNPAGHVGVVTLTIAGVPSGWTLSEGTDNGDGTWSVQTNDVSALTATSPHSFSGAVKLHMAETWSDGNGGTGLVMISNNVEVFAQGNPIYALSDVDHLTGSSGADLFVFGQPISHDTLHNFDAAADRIDLIDFDGVNGFGDLVIVDDGSGNAVVTISSGETITVQGVSGSELGAGNFLFNQEPVTHNAGTMSIADGAIMPLGGTIDNTGTIALNGAGSTTQIEVIASGITLQGGGQIVLSDSDANLISGAAADIALTNVDNIISGAGQLGGGLLGLNNQGTIIATGSNALVIDTGGSTVVNLGTLEATGSGGLAINGAVANSGLIWANGGDVTIGGQVTGDGDAIIGNMSQLEFHAASSADVIFGVNAAGTLRLDDSFDFSGTIAGITNDDKLDLGDIWFSTGTSAVYQANQDGSGGTLLISDGTHDATLHLIGAYDTGTFTLADDGTGRTVVAYNPADGFHFV